MKRKKNISHLSLCPSPILKQILLYLNASDIFNIFLTSKSLSFRLIEDSIVSELNFTVLTGDKCPRFISRFPNLLFLTLSPQSRPASVLQQIADSTFSCIPQWPKSLISINIFNLYSPSDSICNFGQFFDFLNLKTLKSVFVNGPLPPNLKSLRVISYENPSDFPSSLEDLRWYNSSMEHINQFPSNLRKLSLVLKTEFAEKLFPILPSTLENLKVKVQNLCILPSELIIPPLQNLKSCKLRLFIFTDEHLKSLCISQSLTNLSFIINENFVFYTSKYFPPSLTALTTDSNWLDDCAQDLPRNLLLLDFPRASFSDLCLENLPPKLTYLNIKNSTICDTLLLPRSLTILRVSASHFTALSYNDLPPNLITLALYNANMFSNETALCLPRSILDLEITNDLFISPDKINDELSRSLPPNLTNLNLRINCAFSNAFLNHLPKSIKYLSMDHWKIVQYDISHLPNLKSFRTRGNYQLFNHQK